ncbi:unnamed protein product [Calypogeia fissa]
MLSPFCYMVSCRIGTDFTVPVVASSTQMKNSGTRKFSDWASKGAECGCVHLFSMVGNHHRHPVHVHLGKRWSFSDPSIILGLRTAPSSSGRSRRLATKKVIFETVSEEASLEESTNAAAKSCWIGLPAVALLVSALFGGQPAYAELKPNVLADAGVQMELVIDSAPSVEAILAKQLARRFREMSDEELVDILKQLLKASRSSSQNDGIFSEDLVLQNENRQSAMKSAERTHNEKIPATKEIDTNHSKEVKDKPTVSETVEETTKLNDGALTRPQEKSKTGQVDERKTQKLSEKANDQQQQGKDLSIGQGNDGKSDGQFSETQERSRGGSSASVPPTTELNAGDMSVRSKSGSSDPGAASAAHENIRGGSREGEDVTELLWAEWSRRNGGQVVEQTEPSSPSFNVVEFGQDVMKKVAEFTALQKAIGVLTIWSFFMVLAYSLGRAKASSRKDIPRSNGIPINEKRNRDLPIVSSDGRTRRDRELGLGTLSQGFDFLQNSVSSRISGLKEFASKGKRVSDASNREDNYEGGISPGEGQSSRKTDSPENGKWWRTALRDDLLSQTQETSVRSQGKNQVGGDVVLGDSRQDLNYLSKLSKNGTRTESTIHVGTRSDVNDSINSEMKQLQVHSGREETSRGPRIPQYPSKVSMSSVDSKSTELQVAGDQPGQRGSQSSGQVEWRNPDVRETSGHRDPEDLSTSDDNFMSPIVDSFRGRSLDHRSSPSPTGDFSSEATTNYEHLEQKDSLEGVNAKQGARAVEGLAASESEAKLNSFVHEHVLWVRDDDGIFIRQAAAMEVGDRSNATRGEQDMPESTRSFDAERNSRKVEGSNLSSSVVRMKQRKESGRGFDYRQLVINSKDEYLPTDQGFATKNEPDTLRLQMWPLRYGSGWQQVSE